MPPSELPSDVSPEVSPEVPAEPHRCHATGCREEVPPRLLMCAHHWWMVPKEIRKRIWVHYRPGQEIDKKPTKEYLGVMIEAIQAVEVKEMGKPK